MPEQVPVPEPSSGRNLQPTLDVQPVLDSIRTVHTLVTTVQRSIPPAPEATVKDDSAASIAAKGRKAGFPCFGLPSSAGGKVSASQGVPGATNTSMEVKVKAQAGPRGRWLARLAVSAGKKSRSGDGAAAGGTGSQDVKAETENAGKAAGDQQAASTAGGNHAPATPGAEVETGGTTTGSSDRSASPDKKGSSSDQANAPTIDGPGDGSRVNLHSAAAKYAAGSTRPNPQEVQVGAQTKVVADRKAAGNNGGSQVAARTAEIKTEAAAATSPGHGSASTDKEGSGSQQVNGPTANSPGDASKVNGDGTNAGSKKNLKGDNLKAYNQAEKLLRDLNYIKSELSKLDGMASHFQGIQDPTNQLQRVLDSINKADVPSFPTQTVHAKLQSLADKVKVVKNQMPGHNVPTTNTEGSHQVVKDTAFNAYHLLDKTSSLEIKKRIRDTPCFDNFLGDFNQAFSGLDLQSKLCLLCFSIFPENAVLHKKLLVYWWIGEGLVDPQVPAKKGPVISQPPINQGLAIPQPTFNQGLPTPQPTVNQGSAIPQPPVNQGSLIPPLPGKTANEVLTELCSKGFIKPVLKKHKLSGFQLDTLVRFVVISIAERVGFFHFDSMGVPTADFCYSHRACLVKDKEGKFSRTDLTREKETQSSKKDKEDPSQRDPTIEKDSQKNMDYLQTLFNVNDPYPDFKLEWISKLKMLNVLYLGGWQGSKGHHIEVEGTEFLKGLKNMKYLKFLSLQGISRITELNDSLCDVTNLRILDLNACHHLESLPKKLDQLKGLTHLDISECYLLDHIPKGLAQLTSLQVLKGFVVGGSGNSKDSCTLAELGALKNLIKLSITSSREDFPSPDEVTVLKGFEYLKKLTIAWGGKSSKAEGAYEAAPADKANITETKGRKGNAGEPKEEGKGKTAKEKTGDVGNISVQKEENKGKGLKQKAEKEITAEKKKQDEDTSKEQPQEGGNIAEQKKAEKGKRLEKKVRIGETTVAGDIAEQKGDQGNNAEKSKRDKGEGAEQQNTSAKSPQTMPSPQPTQPAPAAKFTPTPSKKWVRMPSFMGSASSVANPTPEASSKLEKLELQCYPLSEAPHWMVKGELKPIKKLYIRGGNLRALQRDPGKQVEWTVEILCLKYLADLEMIWTELQKSFPKLVYLEKSRCPKLTFFPCNSSGVWINKKSELFDDVKKDLSWSFLA